MRRLTPSMVMIATCVAACGGFGSEDDDDKPAPAATPADNAKPPTVDGTPLTGIFVSSSKGQPGRSGLPDSPIKTITEGLVRAKAENLRLIVCAEDYAENVELVDGVSAYGYFDCSTLPWKKSEKRARVIAPASPALLGRNINAATRIEGFDFIAPDLNGTTAKDRVGSSVGGELRKIAPNVLFFNEVTFHGGNAAPGADGTVTTTPPAPDGVFDGTPGFDQSYSSCTSEVIACAYMAVPGVKGPAPTCGAERAPAPGGDGGDGQWFINWEPTTLMTPNVLHGRPLSAIPGAVAVGGDSCATSEANPACGRGADGSRGAAGVVGATGQWSFDGDGFVLGNAKAGGTGDPGQSGGGGGSSDKWHYGPGNVGNPPYGVGTGYNRSARGGSGAAGGCGGLGGGGGSGGGASIGLLAFDAPAVLERVVVESANGGTGGAGASGSAGSAGGTGGFGPSGSGRGGDGGKGGSGGPGGHGASGPSIALAFLGPRLTTGAGTDLRPGAGGDARPALTDGPSGRLIPATSAGPSLKELDISTVPNAK